MSAASALRRQRLLTNQRWHRMSHLINGQAVNAVFISHPVATSRSALYASLEPTDNHHHESISPADSRASSLRGTPSSLSSVDAFGPIDCRVEKGLSGFHGGLLNATCVRSVNLAHLLRSFLALSVFQVCFLVSSVPCHRSRTT